MVERIAEIKLENGTMIRHRIAGYEGQIDGTTQIKECFTSGGKLLGKTAARHVFQYRVVVAGESMRRIAPDEDLEVLDGVIMVICPACGSSFQSKPGAAGKVRGRCECGQWICPNCLSCQGPMGDSKKAGESDCLKQRKRLVSKLAKQKKSARA
jgi:hypothetical protein